MGYQAFDRETNIAGIILNKIGTLRQQDKMRQALERYTDIPVIGAVPRNKDFAITERHLGPHDAVRNAGTSREDREVRAAVEDGIDVDRVA